MPYLTVLSDFREGVRKIAREQKGNGSVALKYNVGGCFHSVVRNVFIVNLQ